MDLELRLLRVLSRIGKCVIVLEKTDPTATVSSVKKPIVYYLDRGTPEPVRSALLDGARWWSSAFEKAGYKDAFRVRCCRKVQILWTSAITRLCGCIEQRVDGLTVMRLPIRAPVKLSKER